MNTWYLIPLLVMCQPVVFAETRDHAVDAARFERMLEERPDDPAVHYNLGTSWYRADEFDKAEESLNSAVAASDASLRARAAYNLGNTRYRMGRAQETVSPNAASQLYRQALDDYRSAIRQDPDDRDAQFNYELVGRRLEALELQQEQSQQPQQGQDQQQEQPQPGEDGSEQQRQQASSSGASGEEQQEPQGGEEQQQAQAGDPAGEDSGQQRAGSPDGSDDGEQQHAQDAAQEDGAPEAEELSKRMAMQILDTLRREERRAGLQDPREPAREVRVEQDW